MAFQDYKPWLGITGSRWIGLDNFERIFQYKEATQAIVNTLIIAVSKDYRRYYRSNRHGYPAERIRNIGIKKVYSTGYLPHFLSWVTVAG